LRRGLITCVCVCAALPATAAAQVSVHVTPKGAHSGLRPAPALRWQKGAGSGGELVRVQPGRRFQPLTAGFGVALTDTSAWLIRRKLPPRLRDRVMRQLFARRGGIGLSYLRIPMGASDYIVHRPYTYDDMPPGGRDPRLRRFSLRHDRAYVFPAVRQALALNRRMTVMANPWTPPAWMKTDDSLIPTGAGPVSSLRADAYGPYARYLVEVLGHCAECHSARDTFGAIKPKSRLAGGIDQEQVGYDPNITPAGIGQWSEDEIVHAITTGQTPERRQLGSSMEDVVQNIAGLPPDDQRAIAAYLKTVPSRTSPDAVKER